MSAAVLLLLGTLLLTSLAPRALRSSWTERAPLLGIVLWGAVTVTVVGSVILAALSLAAPPAMLEAGVGAWVQACLAAIQVAYGAPEPAALIPLGGLLVAGGVTLRIVWCAAGEIRRVRRERREHLDALTLLGRAEGGVVVLSSDIPVAYCVPGRHERVVVSSGAIEQLEPSELAAVLAHERAHLAERHDLLVLAVRILTRAFGRVALFHRAEASMSRLVEMRADDVAAERSGRLEVAAALVSVAAGASPLISLAAGGPTTVARVQRLLGDEAPLGGGAVVAGGLSAAVLLVAPVLVLTIPAALGIVATYCPILPA